MDYKDMAAIGIVRLMLTDGVITKEIAGKYFPELKESEGGKIREKLIAFLSQCKAVYGDSFQQYDLNIDEALAWLEKQGEQKPTWDEDDKLMFQCAITHFECQKRNCIDGGDRKKAMQDFIDWLKSLRPQKQDIMSEDEFIHIVGYLVQDIVANEHMAETEKQPTKFFVEKYYKKLKPQFTWKPSEEQIIALRWILNNVPYNKHKEEISGLLEQIKDLV